jgi:hypothetical protein
MGSCAMSLGLQRWECDASKALSPSPLAEGFHASKTPFALRNKTMLRRRINFRMALLSIRYVKSVCNLLILLS